MELRFSNERNSINITLEAESVYFSINEDDSGIYLEIPKSYLFLERFKSMLESKSSVFTINDIDETKIEFHLLNRVEFLYLRINGIGYSFTTKQFKILSDTFSRL